VAGIVDRLLSFLDLGCDYVACEALAVVRDLLRVAPHTSDACISAISALPASLVSEPQGRAAYAFIMGEYGHILPEAPYALEPFLLALPQEPSPEVRLELLTAVAKLFIHRPAECQRVLGAALSAAANDGDADVRDRALMYYRLLASTSGVDGLKAVVVPPQGRLDAPSGVGAFEDDVAQELRDRLFAEFNTLSVVYGRPASSFVDARDRATAAAAAAQEEELLEGGAGMAGDNLLLDVGEDDDLLGGGIASPAYAAVTPKPGGADLLDDFPQVPSGTPLVAPATPQPAQMAAAMPPPATSPPALPPCPLAPGVVMDPGTFQAHWAAWPVAQQGAIKLTSAGLAALTSHTAALMPHMSGANIATMASGGSGGVLKWYFYAQLAALPAGMFLAELIVDTSAGTANITIKTDAAHASKAFAANFAQLLLEFPPGVPFL